MESKVIGLVADPDLPTEIAGWLTGELPQILTSEVSATVNWDVRVHTIALPLDKDGNIEIWQHSDRLKAEEGYDYLVCLTELTRHLEGQFALSDVNPSHGAALVSLPALGPIRIRRQACKAVVRVLRIMVNGDLQPDLDAVTPGAGAPHKSQGPIRQETTGGGDGGYNSNSYLALEGIRGRVRLLLGMVRINRPWRMLPSLASVLAAATTAAAFGIFFSSIWTVSDSLAPARLVLIAILGIGVMIAWLIFQNGLWERTATSSSRRAAATYNTATILTLTVGVVFMYILLFTGNMFASLMVIPGGYMETILGHPVSLLDYASLAWFATSLGIVGGALGSSFESESAIEQATYGKREQQRHSIATEQDRAETHSESPSGQ